MDWIERLWHVDPDHGNGSLELAIFFVLAVCVLFALSAARGRRQKRHRVRR